MITAKIKCTSKVYAGMANDEELSRLEFTPDYRDGRNAEWAAATPSLSLCMTVRGAVADRFEVGTCYTLTFEPAAD